MDAATKASKSSFYTDNCQQFVNDSNPEHHYSITKQPYLYRINNYIYNHYHKALLQLNNCIILTNKSNQQVISKISLENKGHPILARVREWLLSFFKKPTERYIVDRFNNSLKNFVECMQYIKIACDQNNVNQENYKELFKEFNRLRNELIFSAEKLLTLEKSKRFNLKLPHDYYIRQKKIYNIIREFIKNLNEEFVLVNNYYHHSNECNHNKYKLHTYTPAGMSEKEKTINFNNRLNVINTFMNNDASSNQDGHSLKQENISTLQNSYEDLAQKKHRQNPQNQTYQAIDSTLEPSIAHPINSIKQEKASIINVDETLNMPLETINVAQYAYPDIATVNNYINDKINIITTSKSQQNIVTAMLNPSKYNNKLKINSNKNTSTTQETTLEKTDNIFLTNQNTKHTTDAIAENNNATINYASITKPTTAHLELETNQGTDHEISHSPLIKINTLQQQYKQITDIKYHMQNNINKKNHNYLDFFNKTLLVPNTIITNKEYNKRNIQSTSIMLQKRLIIDEIIFEEDENTDQMSDESRSINDIDDSRDERCAENNMIDAEIESDEYWYYDDELDNKYWYYDNIDCENSDLNNEHLVWLKDTLNHQDNQCILDFDMNLIKLLPQIETYTKKNEIESDHSYEFDPSTTFAPSTLEFSTIYKITFMKKNSQIERQIKNDYSENVKIKDIETEYVSIEDLFELYNKENLQIEGQIKNEYSEDIDTETDFGYGSSENLDKIHDEENSQTRYPKISIEQAIILDHKDSSVLQNNTINNTDNNTDNNTLYNHKSIKNDSHNYTDFLLKPLQFKYQQPSRDKNQVTQVLSHKSQALNLVALEKKAAKQVQQIWQKINRSNKVNLMSEMDQIIAKARKDLVQAQENYQKSHEANSIELKARVQFCRYALIELLKRKSSHLQTYINYNTKQFNGHEKHGRIEVTKTLKNSIQDYSTSLKAVDKEIEELQKTIGLQPHSAKQSANPSPLQRTRKAHIRTHKPNNRPKIVAPAIDASQRQNKVIRNKKDT